ncbi:hypothetical protein GCM10010171_08170 [Actinokineospora fastidiosa]|uniref:Uncharacterized protein n=1 Tax=Actinokineospora fastidiosa TaxID=1816 RepID=A0A918G468_9PSEU|nr:hypothetical protein GCM10010171_08170 [Actinokineospora fastidiosa]
MPAGESKASSRSSAAVGTSPRTVTGQENAMLVPSTRIAPTQAAIIISLSAERNQSPGPDIYSMMPCPREWSGPRE